MKNLVVYFSCTGETRKVAEKLGTVLACDIKEIVPVNKYTDEDLNWNDSNSRTSLEANDEKIRPEIKEIDGISDYDTIYLGFPIWWYKAPNIIYSFLEKYNLEGKTIIPFATSGGSGIERAEQELRKIFTNIEWKQGKKLSSFVSTSELSSWINTYLK